MNVGEEQGSQGRSGAIAPDPEERFDQPGGWLCRAHGEERLPVLVYLPGLHGDWTLVSSFRAAVRGRVRFFEFCYPRDAGVSLADHATAVLDALYAAGVSEAWLLAESFGSQVGWAMVEALPRYPKIQIQGLFLAGGFVRYPVPLVLAATTRIAARLPPSALRRLLGVYAMVAKARHRHAPETREEIGEFVRRRLEPGDREAMVHRLRLIAGSDPRPIASQCGIPTWNLTGFWDPIVPWPLIHPWVRHHIPGWQGHRILMLADHTVLATQPGPSARWGLERMNLPRDSSAADTAQASRA
ncbi:MAG: alpha/beta hydrolase [Verrucomicrobiae bacterium]|nr:alpha/beta hydrolase [Verrucomicrobiae bacterium]